MSLLRRYVITPLSLLRSRLQWLHIPVQQIFVLMFLTELLYLPFERQQCHGDVLESFCREILQPVQPGSYVPQPCGEWLFLGDSEAHLHTILDGMRELQRADLPFFTSNHVYFPSCVLLWHDEAMINPTLIATAGTAARFRTTHRALCSAHAEAYEAEYYPSVELEWRDTEARPHSRSFQGSEAREVQLALHILAGEDVCPGEQRFEPQ